MDEGGELPDPPTEPSYQEIREEVAGPEAKETPLQAVPLEERPEKDPPKRKWKQRPRKDVTCPICGKVFSSNTRHHKCIPCNQGKEGCRATASPRGESLAIRAERAEPRPPLTIDEVRTFLTEERTRYRAAQRDAWVGSLF